MLAVGKIHWIVYKDAVIALLLAIIAFGLTSRAGNDAVFFSLSVAGIVLLIAAPMMAIKAWFNQWITEMVVTNMRVIYKHGFIMRHSAEMNMDKIESVTVTQSVLGRILDYGTIHVRGTGEGIEHLHLIRAPIELRNCITAR